MQNDLCDSEGMSCVNSYYNFIDFDISSVDFGDENPDFETCQHCLDFPECEKIEYEYSHTKKKLDRPEQWCGRCNTKTFLVN